MGSSINRSYFKAGVYFKQKVSLMRQSELSVSLDSGEVRRRSESRDWCLLFL